MGRQVQAGVQRLPAAVSESWRKFGQYTVIIWIAVIAVLLVTGAIFFRLNSAIEQEMESEFSKTLQSLTESTARNFQLSFSDLRNELLLLTQLESLRKMDLAKVRMAFTATVRFVKLPIYSLILVDDKGVVKMGVSQGPVSSDMREEIDRFYLETVEANQAIYMGRKPVKSGTFNGFALGVPIYRAKGSDAFGRSEIVFQGVIVALVEYSSLIKTLLAPIQMKTTIVTWALTHHGDLLASTDDLARINAILESEKTSGQAGMAALISEMQAGKSFTKTVNIGWDASIDGQRRPVMRQKVFVSVQPIKFDYGEWSIAFAAPKTDVTELNTRSFRHTVLLTIMVAAAFLLAGFMLTLINRRRLEAERQARHARELETINELKNEFISIVSHDLKSPLNVILGYARALEDEGAKPEIGRAATGIRKSGERLLELVNNMLDLGKLSSGRVELSIEPLNIDRLIRESVAAVEYSALEKGIDIDRQLDSPETVIPADSMRLYQVMGNLLSNAIKFTPAGGRITVCKTASPDSVRISISDTGPGIPAGEIPFLFEKFSRVGSADKALKGTGLGLAICRGIIEMHNGAISVDSPAGSGATFTFTLPLARPSGQLSGQTAEDL